LGSPHAFHIGNPTLFVALTPFFHTIHLNSFLIRHFFLKIQLKRSKQPPSGFQEFKTNKNLKRHLHSASQCQATLDASLEIPQTT